MEDEVQESVPQMESIQLPVASILTALSCAAKDKKDFRTDIKGVHVHAVGEELRVVAIDGHKMLVHSTPIEKAKRGEELPAWVTAGVTIPAEGLKERLSLLDKLDFSTALMTFAVGAPSLFLSDLTGSCVFRMTPIEELFPDYQRIIDTLKNFEGREVTDMESLDFGVGLFKAVGNIATMLGSKTLRMYSTKPGQPMLFTFPGCPAAILILMPLDPDKIVAGFGAGAAKVLGGAVAGTVAALRAHQTRWRTRLTEVTGKGAKAEAEAKIAEYDQRIAAILDKANALPALPAAAVEDEDERDEDSPLEQEDDDDPADAPAAIVDAVEFADVAEQRRVLTPGQRRRAMMEFRSAVNALLLEQHGGLTVGQLAEGVPLEDWFLEGLPVPLVAHRCLDWRKIGTVLPPDEVEPGEADKPMGLLKAPDRAAKLRLVAWSEEDMAAQVAAIEAIEPGSLGQGTQPEPAKALSCNLPNGCRYRGCASQGRCLAVAPKAAEQAAPKGKPVPTTRKQKGRKAA